MSGHGDVRVDPRWRRERLGLASGRSRAAGHGHEAVAVDLPCEQESAGWWAYADAVVEEVAARENVIVVGHSLGGFTAPLVCARIPADLQILLCGIIPSPGELFDDWWKNAEYVERVRRRLLPRRSAAARGRSAATRTRRELKGVAGAVASRLVAGDSDAVPAVPRGPYVHGRMGATARSRTPRHRGGRDGRRPLRHAQPATRTGRAPPRVRREPRLTRPAPVTGSVDPVTGRGGLRRTCAGRTGRGS